MKVWTRTAMVSPYNKTSDVFSPEYKANTSRRIGFSADVITKTPIYGVCHAYSGNMP
jgi:hypothetical protein